MEPITKWTELFFESLQSFGETFMGAIPSVLGAIIILVLGWLFARFISAATAKLLTALKFDKLAAKVKAEELLKQANINSSPSKIISQFIYYILMLIVWITASETLGWVAVSEEISKLISYLPTLFAAILFFIVGMYIATFVRNVIQGATGSLGIASGKTIATVVFYFLAIVVVLTSLDQAGIDISFLTSNMMIIVGSIMAAAAISYGFASREILSNILASFFVKRNFKLGQYIEIDDIKGYVTEISNISITVKTEHEHIIIPTHDFINHRIKTN